MGQEVNDRRATMKRMYTLVQVSIESTHKNRKKREKRKEKKTRDEKTPKSRCYY